MPKREVTVSPVDDNPRAALFVTDVSHLQTGEVAHAPGTVGPLMQYGVLTRVCVEPRGVVVELAWPHTWTDHGPRIRDAVRLAVDLEGWQYR